MTENDTQVEKVAQLTSASVAVCVVSALMPEIQRIELMKGNPRFTPSSHRTAEGIHV